MKSLITLQQLESQLQEREALFRDQVIPASEIRMEEEKGDLMIGGDPHPVQDHVLSLLGPKLNIPAAYLRRCPPSLRAENVNHWMATLGEKDLFVRVDANEVRSILSTRYVPVSNLELVRQLTEHVNGSRHEAIVDLSATRMVCQVVLKEHRQLMTVGDETMGGIHLINSEVGFASIEVARFVFRLVCNNGLIVRQASHSFKRIHLKRCESLQEELRRAFSKVVEGLPRSLESMRSAMEVPLEDPESSLERLPRRYGLTEAEHEAVKAAWQQEQGGTLYHLINSITGAARSEELSTDSRLRLETLAGDLLPA